jgi:hypothetical protein
LSGLSCHGTLSMAQLKGCGLCSVE